VDGPRARSGKDAGRATRNRMRPSVHSPLCAGHLKFGIVLTRFVTPRTQYDSVVGHE
jgi:hypothetical protein